jgi:hypothetical protein
MTSGFAYMAVGMSKSRNEFDNPHLIEVFTEVSILEPDKGDRLEEYERPFPILLQELTSELCGAR